MLESFSSYSSALISICMWRKSYNLDIQASEQRCQFAQDFIIFGESIYAACFAVLRWCAGICLMSCEGQQCLCKPTELSVNCTGKRSEDCFRGTVFVDTLAGKLDMWLCMAELVQLNLSKMELGGNIYLLLLILRLTAAWSISASPPPSLPPRISLYFSFILILSLSVATRTQTLN